MKKQEYISNKNKCKDIQSIKFVRYVQISSMAIILLVILYTMLMASILKVDFAQLISKNLTITCGFILALQALITFYVSKGIVQDLSSFKNVESNRLKLLLVTISSLATVNYITGALGILALVKYFRWTGYFSISSMLKETKQEGRFNECLILLVLYSLLALLQGILGSMVL